MKIVIYIVLVLASAALHTYHPKSQTSATTPTHISKGVASEKADMNSIALNNTGAYQVAAQSN